MFESIRYRWLHSQLRKGRPHAPNTPLTAKDFRRAKNLKLRVELLDAKITNRLLEHLFLYDLELPDDEEGIFMPGGDSASLTSYGRATIRKLIEDEKAKRFEVTTRWVKLLLPIITALVGLIGTITGLIAVLRHTK